MNPEYDEDVRILVVIGDDSERQRIGQFLAEMYVTVAAPTMADALQALSTRTFACIVVDENLVSAAGEAPALGDFLEFESAVVLLAGDESRVALERALQAGAQDRVDKNRLSDSAIDRVVLLAIERRRLITKMRGVERELRESKQWFEDIANRVSDGLWVRNAEGSACLYLNPSFERIWGRTIDEMNRIKWADTVHPDDREQAYAVFLKACSKLSDYKQSYRIVRPDGTVRHIENHAFPVLDAEGRLARMAGIARDVTEERKLQEDLRIAQKLESVGQLAAGIAHEINTPSQYVSDNISFLAESFEELKPLMTAYGALLVAAEDCSADPEQIRKFRDTSEKVDLEYLLDEVPQALEQSRHGIDRIKKIVVAMKDFSHPGDAKEPADLNRAIQTTLTVARNEWKYVADLVLDLDEDLPRVVCVQSAINQVVLNLVVNAAHAISDVVNEGEKGTIRISTGVAGGDAVIRIQDTGGGIPAEIRERIFDPFFTTKEVGRGTGQGLAIAHAVIKEQHGGSIVVDSEPGKGTCFSITIPLAGDDQEIGENAA